MISDIKLQKTSPDASRKNNDLKKKGNKMLVKWKGHGESVNSWIDKTNVA